MNFVDAMGREVGDTLELTNQWARVVITRDDSGDYWVTGDGEFVVSTLKEAVTRALAELADFEAGRC